MTEIEITGSKAALLALLRELVDCNWQRVMRARTSHNDRVFYTTAMNNLFYDLGLKDKQKVLEMLNQMIIEHHWENKS